MVDIKRCFVVKKERKLEPFRQINKILNCQVSLKVINFFWLYPLMI
jgi:hypothetical protein